MTGEAKATAVEVVVSLVVVVVVVVAVVVVAVVVVAVVVVAVVVVVVVVEGQLDPTGPLCTSPTACPTPPCDRPRAALRRTSAGTPSHLGCAPRQGQTCKAFQQPPVG